MIIPAFKDEGENGAEFYCLAFAQVKYRRTGAARIPAALGIYFCAHKDFTRFSRMSFEADGNRLSYTRGDDKHDTLEFVLLKTLLEYSIHPTCWRLFPMVQMPEDFHSDQYEEARHAVCLLFFHFRATERAARATAKAGLTREPRMISDETIPRIAFGDFKEEDQEIEKAILKRGRESNL